MKPRVPALILALLAAAPAVAQIALPGPAQAPQIQRRFDTQTQPTMPSQEGLPTVPDSIAPPPGAETVRFMLRGLDVVGSTVYTPDQWRSLYASLIGQTISLADLYRIADRITAKYRQDGYLLSLAIVPEQKVDNGRVVIRIIEGHIDRVTFTKPLPGSHALPNGLVNRITASQPLTAAALERNVLLIGDLPGINVQSVLRPSPSTFGAADLDIVTQHTPWEGFVSIDNQGSRYIGPYALSAGVSEYSLLGLFEQTDVTMAVDPFDHSMYYGQGVFTLPVHSSGPLAGDTFQIAALYSQARPDLPPQVFPFNTRSIDTEWRVTYFVPVIRSRDQNLSARLSFIWRDLDNLITDLPRDPINPTEEHVRILQPRLTYDKVDSLNGVSIIDMTLNIGLDVFGASRNSDLRLIRQDADGQFVYLKGMLARLQPLTTHFSLFGRFDFQLSSDRLPTTERFGVGGPQLGTGYAPGTLTGDDAIGARLELRYGFETSKNFISGFQLYMHGDYGQVHDRGTLDQFNQSLSSVGVGARMNLFKSLAFNPEITQQLSGRPTDCLNCRRETRFLFSLTQRF